MKAFWLNDGLHLSAETAEERLALEILLASLQRGNLVPDPTPRLGAMAGAAEPCAPAHSSAESLLALVVHDAAMWAKGVDPSGEWCWCGAADSDDAAPADDAKHATACVWLRDDYRSAKAEYGVALSWENGGPRAVDAEPGA